MSYNPRCQKPDENPVKTKFCHNCGSDLVLSDRYRVFKKIGSGGYGKIFLAVDEHKPSKPFCVIKQFSPKVKETYNLEKADELFNREAVLLEKLSKQHSQIPELLAFFTQAQHHYLVQEFIDGENLAEELKKQGAFKEEKIWDLLNNLLPVLQFIHEQNVVHRDIKPANIVRRNSDAQLFLVDFGASKEFTDTALGKHGTIIGTPGYTASEQERGEATYASDIYSLGITCIHLLTGLKPSNLELHSDDNETSSWRKQLENTISERLINILERMVAPSINKRYSQLPRC